MLARERMAFLHRLYRNQLRHTSYHLKFCSARASYPSLRNYSAANAPSGVRGGSFANFATRPADFCGGARFFSAAAEAPLLNEKITVREVRLVTDEGHFVVSIGEALRRAKQQRLDLVMVQKNANPPVCKIMDFHRQKYNQELKNKDRAKSQQGATLRKGDSKEVRFSAAIEAKDLKMKADTVKRLMDRGYRVKCVAMGTEDKDLGGLLSRLTELIEDVSVIESGPRIEKQNAYVIVRHIKFGPSKKGGVKKKVGDTLRAVHEDQSESGLETEVETLSEDEEPSPRRLEIKNNIREIKKPAWSLNDENGDLDSVFEIKFNVENNPNTSDLSVPTRPSSDALNMANVAPKPGPEPPMDPENRYKRSPMNNNRFSHPRSPGQGPRDFSRQEPRVPPRDRWPVQSDKQAPRTEDSREGSNPVFRNLKPPTDDVMRRQVPKTDPSRSAAPVYGIFSSSNK